MHSLPLKIHEMSNGSKNNNSKMHLSAHQSKLTNQHPNLFTDYISNCEMTLVSALFQVQPFASMLKFDLYNNLNCNSNKGHGRVQKVYS